MNRRNSDSLPLKNLPPHVTQENAPSFGNRGAMLSGSVFFLIFLLTST
jgi:hypothetical protein